MPRDTTNALSFGQAVGDYERGRPGYPAAAVDWILAEAGIIDTATRTVVDVGAGTGKFTASLIERGLNVTAIEPDDTMRAALTAKFAHTAAARGTAEHMPLADDSADLVTFAQAWHWVDVDAASAEVARVLRPGGTLALIWNMRDESVDWVARLGEVMGSSAAEDYETGRPSVAAPLHREQFAEFFWDTPLSRDELLALVTSRSYVIAMGADERAGMLRALAELLDGHPELAKRTSYVMPYVTRVTLVRSTNPAA